jgi:hypothetical protein
VEVPEAAQRRPDKAEGAAGVGEVVAGEALKRQRRQDPRRGSRMENPI